MNTPPPLLLLTFLIFTTLSSATSPPPPVLDIAKNPLGSGTNYHILPVFRGLGGGLTLAPTRNNQTCPLDVVQKRQEVRPGLPVTFSPVKAKKGGAVPLSTDLNIKFSAASICGQSTVWPLENRGGGGFVVSSGGVEGKAGRETVNNWFKIEREKEDYKIVFYPTVCSTCRPVCGDIGVEIVNGRRRLGLSDGPLMVMFRRA